MADVRFRFTGADAADQGAALERFLSETFSVSSVRRTSEAGVTAKEGTKADPVAIVALVLSIPAAAMAAQDLAERLKLVEKVKALLAFAKERLHGVEIVGPDGAPLPLDDATPGQVIDLANEVAAADSKPET